MTEGSVMSNVMIPILLNVCKNVHILTEQKQRFLELLSMNIDIHEYITVREIWDSVPNWSDPAPILKLGPNS